MCLCGDIYCGSCGPAQGNDHCYVCGSWSADGGCKDPKACAATLARLDEAAEKEEAELERAEAERERT